MNISDLLRPNILKMKAYSSARDEYAGKAMIQLDANENPFAGEFARYPDPYQNELKAKIAEAKGMSANKIVLGNGSDELIDLVFRAFCIPGKDNVIGMSPSYGMYKVCAELNDVEYREVLLNSDFQLDLTSMMNAIDENTKVIFLCTPNNPSGNVLDIEDVGRLLREFNGIVVMDEAYIDFSTNPSYINTLDENPQIIVLQTLSKFYGLAGLRLGIAYCSEELVAVFNKIKPPYNVNEASQKLAIKNLATIDFSNYKRSFFELKEMLLEALQGSSEVVKVFPSEANFFLVKFKDAHFIYNYLIENGVVVRNRSNQPLCDNCLRITVGNKDEITALINVFDRYEKSIIYR
ncbi:histidinol-phosphate transaminase [Paracrocinitomix mangrovi]|uniref:histidinol-phosphate transaminase n=1 Tax=Paracrocinitomix mangrovi TaxID=2862509 RepID=UPI001C8F0F58|nr:histidinol-phosphate transaminase [Paracrocinitomix mangrovi]